MKCEDVRMETTKGTSVKTATIFLAPVEDRIEFYKDPISAAQKISSEQRYQKIGAIQTKYSGERAADEMFDLSNNPSRQEERNEKWGRYPSLSVGDVVNVDGESYLCLPCGWERL